MKHKALKISLWTLFVIVILFVAASVVGGNYLLKVALQPEACSSYNRDSAIVRTERWNPGIAEWIKQMDEANTFKDTSIVREGFRLLAHYAYPEQPSGKTAVIVHGYTSNPIGMMMIARMFRDSLGYNVLLPNLRYHGLSEGVAVQMGWKDRLDVLEWTKVAHEIFQDSIMVVHGISMGGATTMMLSGEDTPEYVKGFIDDCGYTSVWDQFSKQLKEDYGLPEFPLLYVADYMCRIKYGWGFREASSVNQLARCSKPILFIHGDNDTFVPTYMVYENYEVKLNGYRELWVAPGSRHAKSYADHPAEYTETVRKFLSSQVEQ